MTCCALPHQELLNTIGSTVSTHLHLDTLLTTPHMVLHHTTPHTVLLLMDSLPFKLTLVVDLAHGDVGVAAEEAVVVVPKAEDVVIVEEKSATVMHRPVLVRFL